ncbi:MAG: addiction module toxin RelE [Nitrospira sp.]|nr:addiction module toxin RelE [Nitrospira sp.]
MARPLRIEFPNAAYHITSRGNARQRIFLDARDYSTFLEILCSVVKKLNWILHVYCLMSNHYHLLLETPEGNLSRGMRQLNGIYTQQFNRRHNRIGHVLQGRYKAILVDKDNYLLELCRYVVLNPVRAGVVRSPKEWQWSSYGSTTGYRKGIPCLTTEWILLQFGNERKEASRRYREFVHEGLKEESPLKEVKGQLFLGEDSFIERFQQLMKDKETLKEIPRLQRYVARPLLEEILKKRKLEDVSIYRAHVKYGYTLKEIGEYLGVHYTTVSRATRRAEGKT